MNLKLEIYREIGNNVEYILTYSDERQQEVKRLLAKENGKYKAQRVEGFMDGYMPLEAMALAKAYLAEEY